MTTLIVLNDTQIVVYDPPFMLFVEKPEINSQIYLD
jgi:hypothetical protein